MFFKKKDNKEEVPVMKIEGLPVMKTEDFSKLIKEEKFTPKEEKFTAEPPVEWIWVDGIKATNLDMTGRNKFQFEVGKKYVHEGPVVPCESGFHFSLTIRDVLEYYGVHYSRFFHVRGLVKKEDYDNYGKTRGSIYNIHSFCSPPYSSNRMDKLTAKEIEIVSEFTEAEYVEVLSRIPFVQNFSDIELLWRIKDHSEFSRIKAKEMLLECDFSETFILALIDASVSSKRLWEIVLLAKGFKDMGVSIDMRVYLIMKRMYNNNM